MVYNMGIIGFPLSHTKSPIIHRFLLNEFKLNGGYVAFETSQDDLHHVVTVLRRYKFAGFNVTLPYKRDVIQYCDFVNDDVKMLESCNTVKYSEGSLYGSNTDYIGFYEMLKYHDIADVAGKDIVLFGAGGSSISVAYALHKLGATSIHIVNRTFDNAERLMTQIKKFAPEMKVKAFGLNYFDQEQHVDYFINSTSIGVSDGHFVDVHNLTADIAVDLFYSSKETPFLKAVTATKKYDGVLMLAFQAIKAFEFFTDREIYIDNNLMERLTTYIKSFE